MARDQPWLASEPPKSKGAGGGSSTRRRKQSRDDRVVRLERELESLRGSHAQVLDRLAATAVGGARATLGGTYDLSTDQNMDGWRRAWRELWELEAADGRAKLTAELAQAGQRIASLEAALAREEEAGRAHEAERREWAATATTSANAAASREDALRAALQGARWQTETATLRVAKAEAVAAAAEERAQAAEARAERTRELSEASWQAKLAALHAELSRERDLLRQREGAASAFVAERRTFQSQLAEAEARATSATREAAASAEERDALDALVRTLQADVGSRDAQLVARTTEVAELAAEMAELAAQVRSGRAEAEVASTQARMHAEARAECAIDEMGVQADAARRDVGALRAELHAHSTHVSLLSRELHSADGGVAVLREKLVAAEAALTTATQAIVERDARLQAAQSAAGAATDEGRHMRALIASQRQALGELRGHLERRDALVVQAERAFEEAAAAMQAIGEHRCRTHELRLDAWDAWQRQLTGAAILPSASSEWPVGSHAAIELIRGRRALEEVGHLIHAERELQAEQLRLYTSARDECDSREAHLLRARLATAERELDASRQGELGGDGDLAAVAATEHLGTAVAPRPAAER